MSQYIKRQHVVQENAQRAYLWGSAAVSQLCPKNDCRERQRGGSAKVIRHGSFPVRYGRQRRYRCLGCGETFSRRIDTAYYRFRCSQRTFDCVAQMAVEGMSRAAIARVEGVGWSTVDWWINRAAAFAKRFNDVRTKGIELIELHADEIRTFAPSKAQPTWVFTSMEVCSRFWVATVVGRSSYRSTFSLINDTLGRRIIEATPLIATDGFKF